MTDTDEELLELEQRIKTDYHKVWLQISDRQGIHALAPATKSVLKRYVTHKVDPSTPIIQDLDCLLQALKCSSPTTAQSRWSVLRNVLHHRRNNHLKQFNVSDDIMERDGFFCEKYMNDSVTIPRSHDVHPLFIQYSRPLSTSERDFLESNKSKISIDLNSCVVVKVFQLNDAVQTWMKAQLRPISLLSIEKSAQLADLVVHRSSNHVDNTGNIRIWPAEQWMAVLLVASRKNLLNASVLELGAGNLGLAGFFSAVNCTFSKMFITDGNDAAANGLIVNKEWLSICVQRKLFRHVSTILAQDLVWHTDYKSYKSGENLSVQNSLENSTEPSTYQLIFAADCLFFEDFHFDLLATIYNHLSNNTTDSETDCSREAYVCPNRIPQAWMLAPSRGGSLERFIERAKAWSLRDDEVPAFHLNCIPLQNVLRKLCESECPLPLPSGKDTLYLVQLHKRY